MKTFSHVFAIKAILAICAASVSLFAVSTTTFAGSVEVLNFDQIANNSALTNGYGFLNWTNFYAINAVGTNSGINPSGYEADVISPDNVLYNNNGTPAAIYSNGHPFILGSAYLAAAWNDNLQVQVNAYSGNRLAYSRTFILSATQPTHITFPMAFLTEVDFISLGGTHHAGYAGNGEQFALDNLSIAILSQSVMSFPLHLPTTN